MDGDNKYTINVRNGTEVEVFNNATEPDEDGDRLQFNDKNGKNHIFKGVSYHIAEE
jgi:hypothetical protein